jgi:hypothetical protein
MTKIQEAIRQMSSEERDTLLVAYMEKDKAWAPKPVAIEVRRREMNEVSGNRIYNIIVILEDGQEVKIHFRNPKSEVLYIYALLHPRGFLRESLNRPGCPKLANLYTILYMADPRILVNQASQNFDRMMSQAISDARRSIEDALIFAEELSFGNPRHYDMKIVIPAVYDGLEVILDPEISAYQHI